MLSVTQLITILRDANNELAWDECWSAAKTISIRGSDIQLLLRELRHGTPETKLVAMDLLERVAFDWNGCKDELCRLIEDSDSEVRRTAFQIVRRRIQQGAARDVAKKVARNSSEYVMRRIRALLFVIAGR
jgi:hypothetical protein